MGWAILFSSMELNHFDFCFSMCAFDTAVFFCILLFVIVCCFFYCYTYCFVSLFFFLPGTALYHSPFFRVLAMLVGHPRPADKHTFQRLMRSGKSLALIPGGFESATITSSTQPRVHVKKKGFIKYALQHGYGL
jgi:hypothetical protein